MEELRLLRQANYNVSMKICKLCGNKLPNLLKIDGKVHNISSRKYCIRCSPFKAHNTKPLPKILATDRRKCSKCGDTNPTHFYGQKTRMCRDCDNAYTIEKARLNKRRAREYLGGKCALCGFDKFEIALDIHHIDPQKKDKNFDKMRGWCWERIEKELQGCILLCKICHVAFHNGLISIIDKKMRASSLMESEQIASNDPGAGSNPA